MQLSLIHIYTIVICTMTGLAIITTDAWDMGLEGVEVTAQAFSTGFPFAPVLGQDVYKRQVYTEYAEKNTEKQSRPLILVADPPVIFARLHRLFLCDGNGLFDALPQHITTVGTNSPFKILGANRALIHCSVSSLVFNVVPIVKDFF